MRNFNWLVKSIFYKHQSAPLSAINATKDCLFYNVTYIPQQHANMCVDASAAMLDNFFHLSIPSLRKNPRGVFIGLNPEDLGNDFGLKNINIENGTKDVKQLLTENGPFILALPLKYMGFHAVVCIGATNDHLIYHDPLDKNNLTISCDELKKFGKNNFECLVKNNTQAADLIPLQQTDITKLESKVFVEKSAYASFFSLQNKHEFNPQQDIIKLLKDYANGSPLFHPFRNYREEVNRFLTTIDPSMDVAQIVKKLNDAFQAWTTGKTLSKNSDLQQRLETINSFCLR